MPSARYIKIKLCRLLSGRGMLLLVPLVWVCVLLWSARTADISARSSLHVHRDSQRSPMHKPGHSNLRDSHHSQKDSGRKRHRNSEDHGVGHDNKDEAPPPPSMFSATMSNMALLKKIGFIGGVKKKAQPKKDQPKDALPKPRRSEVEVVESNARLRQAEHAHVNASALLEQTRQELSIPVVRDRDYWEVRSSNHDSEKRPILPGQRKHPPKKGEGGRAVNIRPEQLSAGDRDKWETGWENHNFNEFASSQISIEREVPDYRPPGCVEKPPSSNLPRASIIICFYNEAWTVLLRTIHSVFRKSPPELIAEVILVDDFSDAVVMDKPLAEYVATVSKLRLLRMTKRSGLVKARLAGIKEASGPVLVFLDSHVECEEGWLPPLLEVIAQHPDKAVTPGIDVIDHKTFSFGDTSGNIGGMDFEGLTFTWISFLPWMRQNTTSDADVIVSPTMAGGLFAIDKQFFLKIGTYDPGLLIWGGENIELSLKLWMCGGGIVVHPCSRVAHIFRDHSPYLQGDAAEVVVRNSARVAQVWLDDYKKFYFKTPYDESIYGSVEQQLQLKQSLKCKNFSWYLKYVYPDLHIEGSGPFLGKIMSFNGLCISQGHDFMQKSALVLTDCAVAVCTFLLS
ncbi:hypothetical protein EGW08_017425 [Elysia chlorotica]|uniref:Glycosyltransferase 2-like domain-containing protein n=1 Tax=Elysia chlorotica TaxID=188477 RepID=A0A3S1H9E8_ELYCH|nr:hypothetical protein EGW08_017425 [Elysia chlorotica]